MKHYIKFKILSTGYVEGTIPPQFSKDQVRPIDACGSDSVYYLDNRLSLSNMILKGRELCEKRGNKVGFSIYRYHDSLLHSKEVVCVVF
jgi:hypothetical protein